MLPGKSVELGQKPVKSPRLSMNPQCDSRDDTPVPVKVKQKSKKTRKNFGLRPNKSKIKLVKKKSKRPGLAFHHPNATVSKK